MTDAQTEPLSIPEATSTPGTISSDSRHVQSNGRVSPGTLRNPAHTVTKCRPPVLGSITGSNPSGLLGGQLSAGFTFAFTLRTADKPFRGGFGRVPYEGASTVKFGRRRTLRPHFRRLSVATNPTGFQQQTVLVDRASRRRQRSERRSKQRDFRAAAGEPVAV